MKDNVFSIIRATFIFLGTFVIGHPVFGQTLDAHTYESVTGGIVVLIMAIWGIATKDTGIEQIESFVRSGLEALGGYLSTLGLLNGGTVTAILGALPSIFALIQSFTSKAKVVQMAKDQATPEVNDSGKFTGKLCKKAA